MMTRQSMARVSSASPEADFDPPFDWEAASRSAASKSFKYGGSAFDSDDGPALPFPPGRRPKDGFYLPFSREPPDFQSGNSSKPRKLFNLKFPGSVKKPSSISRIRLPFQSSSKPAKDEDQGFRGFGHFSGQRFGSSITSRMILQFQKKQSLWRRCLPSKPESANRKDGVPCYIDPNRGRRLDEGLDEGYVTAVDSGPSQPCSLPASPVHVNSSRFMASMLISLCPDDAGGSNGAQFDAPSDGNSDDSSSEIGIPHLTTPRTKSSSPEAFEIEMDPASQIPASQVEWTCTCRHRANISARFELSMPGRGKSVSRNLHEELAAAEHFLNTKPAQPRSHKIEDFATKFDEDAAFFKSSSNREIFRSRESCYKSSFSRKPCTEKSQESKSASKEFTNEPIYDDDGEECEWRGRNRIVKDRSTSPEFESLHKTACHRPNSRSRDSDLHVPKSKAPSMIGYLSPPRISIDDLEFTSNSDQPKAFARWRSNGGRSSLRKTSSLETGGQKTFATPLQRQGLQRNSKITFEDPEKPAKPTPPKPFYGSDDTDESSDDSDCFTNSSGYQTPPAVSSHLLLNFASPKPASSKPLKPSLQSPRIRPFVVDHETTLPQRIIMARSHSVRSSSSRRFTPQEYQAESNVRGLTASRLARTSSSSVMSKVALFESKALVSKSGPLSYSSYSQGIS